MDTGNALVLVGLVKFDNDVEHLRCWDNAGKCVYPVMAPRNDDLFMLPEKKSGWVNVYSSSDNRVCLIRDAVEFSKEQALALAGPGVIDTILIEWEE